MKRDEFQIVVEEAEEAGVDEEDCDDCQNYTDGELDREPIAVVEKRDGEYRLIVGGVVTVSSGEACKEPDYRALVWHRQLLEEAAGNINKAI